MTDQPARYRRTPAEIEAVQWTGTNTGALRAFAGSDFDTIDPEDRIEDPDQDAQLLVEASHWVGIKAGDWVVKYEGYFVAKADATFRAVWEPAAVSVPPSADQTALRQRIAEAVRRVPIKYGAGPDAYTIQPVSIEEADVIAAAVEAVLPPDDRAAALREAADVAVRAARGCGDSEAGQYAASVAAGIGKELRRVAAEEQAASCAECGHPRTVHREGDDPVTPGECSACPDDDARHDYRRAVGEQPETQETLCPAKHGALGRICELPPGHSGMHVGDGPNGGAVWQGDAP